MEKFFTQKFFTHFLQEKDRLMTDISDNIYHETRKEEGRQEITMSEKLKEKDVLKASEQITYKEILKNEEINAMIEQGNNVLKCLGYTEHSKKHAAKVAEHAAEILKMTLSLLKSQAICMILEIVSIVRIMRIAEQYSRTPF